MLSAVFIISFYALKNIYEKGIAEEVNTYNPETMWSMVGFSIYTFEGIGILMPVM